MINTPVFKAHLHVEVIPGEGVLILSEEAAKALHGGAYEKIVPLMDGRHSTDEIVDALSGQVDAARVYYVLNGMEANGYLAEATPDIPASVAAFWHGAGIEPAAALAALRESGWPSGLSAKRIPQRCCRLWRQRESSSARGNRATCCWC